MTSLDSKQVEERLAGKKVLLVEDDSAFRKTISDLLTRAGMHVRDCENGLVAKTVFNLQPDAFDLIISDLRMPVLGGVELLQYLRLNGFKIPFLIMTGFSEILETKSASELGANHFLPKPFRRHAILEAAFQCLYPEVATDPEPSEQQEECQKFLSISIREFLTSTKLVSDVYVKLGSDRFIKVACQDDSVDLERIRAYENKRVDYLYVRKEDFARYVGFALNVARLASSQQSITNDRKLSILAYAANAVASQALLEHIDRKRILDAQSAIVSTLDVITEDDTILSLISEMKDRQDRQFAHTLLVVALSAMIARQHGWNSATSTFKVIASALFHDVGKREIPTEVLSKPRFLRTPAEIALFESHPSRSRDILLSISSLPDEIALVAFHHHERLSGSGYPQRLTGASMHPIAKLVSLVDHFSELATQEPSAKGNAALEALRRMDETKEDWDPQFFSELKELMKNSNQSDKRKAG